MMKMETIQKFPLFMQRFLMRWNYTSSYWINIIERNGEEMVVANNVVAHRDEFLKSEFQLQYTLTKEGWVFGEENKPAPENIATFLDEKVAWIRKNGSDESGFTAPATLH